MADASVFLSVETRLAALERQVRVQKRLLVIAMVAVVAAFGAGAAGAAQKSLTFADAHGHTRVKIDASGFQMFDGSGQRRIVIGFNQVSQPSMYLQDEKGRYVLGAYVSSSREPVFHIADFDHNGDAYFGFTQDDHRPRIDFEADGHQRLFVGLSTQSSGLVRTFNASGHEQTSLENDKVWVTDDSGNTRVYLGTATSGDGILKLYDAESRQRIYAGVFTEGTSGFQAMDASGNVTWSSSN
jgi:hypothetical protein